MKKALPTFLWIGLLIGCLIATALHCVGIIKWEIPAIMVAALAATFIVVDQIIRKEK
jgi:hypothetical protein